MDGNDAFEQWLIEQRARADGSHALTEYAIDNVLYQYRRMKARGVIEVVNRPMIELPPDSYEKDGD